MTRHSLFVFVAVLAAVFTVRAADDDKKTKELKVIAKTQGLPGKPAKGPRPIGPKDALPASVVRNAEELVAANGLKDKAKDEATQKEVMAAVAKALSVDKIDWKTQMLVVIDEGAGINRFLTVGSLKVQDKKLTVTYNIDMRQGGAALRTNCQAVLLVERWDGEVKFNRTYSRSGDPRAP
jgi:hypothetical protein